MSVKIESFGNTKKNEPVTAVTLSNGIITCRMITYSAALQALKVPSKSGEPVDVVLGYDTVREYEENGCFFGSICGRYANRICKGQFSIDGVSYQLDLNNGANHLHGGANGFWSRNWALDSTSDTSATFSIDSPDGDANYPGHLHLAVTYSISASSLNIRYLATSDKKTVCNFTNHSYFNLAGHDSGDVLDQILVLNADSYTPVDSTLIPTGEIVSVKGTPFDFTEPHRIGERINADHPQIALGTGYDHNFAINNPYGNSRLFASAYSEKTGIYMNGYTTSPGVQLYTGNHIGNQTGKGGASYSKHSGFCLETQIFPDAPNQPNFQNCILEPGQTFDENTTYEFLIKK